MKSSAMKPLYAITNVIQNLVHTTYYGMNQFNNSNFRKNPRVVTESKPTRLDTRYLQFMLVARLACVVMLTRIVLIETMGFVAQRMCNVLFSVIDSSTGATPNVNPRSLEYEPTHRTHCPRGSGIPGRHNSTHKSKRAPTRYPPARHSCQRGVRNRNKNQKSKRFKQFLYTTPFDHWIPTRFLQTLSTRFSNFSKNSIRISTHIFLISKTMRFQQFLCTTPFAHQDPTQFLQKLSTTFWNFYNFLNHIFNNIFQTAKSISLIFCTLQAVVFDFVATRTPLSTHQRRSDTNQHPTHRRQCRSE